MRLGSVLLILFFLLVSSSSLAVSNSIDDGRTMAVAANNYLNKKNYTLARIFLERAASSDDEQAKKWANSILAWIYFNGLEVKKDYQLAQKHYQKAANRGDAWSKTQLGLMYLQGLGLNKDEAKALSLFQQAAESGEASAMVQLGRIYSQGLAQPQDQHKARQYFKKAAEQGNASALWYLANLYLDGLGVTKNSPQARQYLQQAAQAGHVKAQEKLAELYVTGVGGKPDLAKARLYFKQAADAGNMAASTQLGLLYLKGLGGDKNAITAQRYLQKAADKADPLALASLKNIDWISIDTQSGVISIAPYFKVAKKIQADGKNNDLTVFISHGQQKGFFLPLTANGFATSSLQELAYPSEFLVTLFYGDEQYSFSQQVDDNTNKAMASVTNGQFSIDNDIHELPQNKLKEVQSFKRINQELNNNAKLYLSSVHLPELPILAPSEHLPEIIKPILPEAPVIKKSQFETKQVFQKRVQVALDEREQTIEKLQYDYRLQVEKRNRLMSNKIAKLQTEEAALLATYQQRLSRLLAGFEIEQQRLTAQAFKSVMGKPYLQKVSFDAENQRLYASIGLTRSTYSPKISVDISSERAKAIYQDMEHVAISLNYQIKKQGKVRLTSVTLGHNNQSYQASLTNETYQPDSIQVVINSQKILKQAAQVKAPPYKIPSKPILQNPNLLDKYQINAITYVNNQQRKAGKPFFVDDIPSLLKAAQPRKVSNKRWLLVIGIENYKQTDNILYARRSAKLFTQVAQRTLGISKRNTYQLIDGQATVGAIKDKVRLMLGNVKKGDEIFFYYNGHGIPDPKDKNQPYLLAADKIPDFVTQDAFFKLENFYRLLSNSKAEKIVAFVDSCFSGATDGVSTIKGVASSRLAPKKVKFDSDKMVILTAGRNKQYANVFARKGNRLFSYFLMKKILAGEKNIELLYKEVRAKVRDESYKMGDLKIQEPSIQGNHAITL